ncbi:D-2-hydroxyacid dehydrogenase [Bordetella genomosp. 11]|uniref:Hydroxyacid dehydrogenase n=1 Tax=Bordetella genomosp. 11 TaxID=1416808 RepID=A0A261UK42_9BORD|nr:D-2-hydroxyacid dehydrogenase [Bordetella genomosp. 11]OZI62268.1 hydroxyacid dehydrogenase [Bordetella genomosp. 11]
MTIRILLSRNTADRLREPIARVMNGRPYELRLAEPTLGHAHADIDVAFISRDVTGASTKHQVTESLEAFYESLRASPGLRWVHVHSAGLDRPIFPELKARGVTVSASAGANSEPVMQTALAGLLALNRRMHVLMDAQRQGRWLKATELTVPRDLAGQVAVIVGWGSIGQRLGAVLRLLGLRIAVVRSSAEPVDADTQTVAFEDIGTLLPRADWLILACPLSDRTRGLIDARALAALPKGAHLVNVARGEVVVEADLIAALRSGHLGGAYLDVYEHEPLDAASPLWHMPNVIATPHAAGHSDGNARRVDAIWLEKLEQWLAENT